jgi:hypothetical protein
MRTGDLVELRAPAEILSTLDSDGCADGLPFMPEMLAFYGRRFRVAARVERACDTHLWSGTRRFEHTVTLDDLRCDGSAHEGCGAKCRLFWRETWLRSVADDSSTESYGAFSADAAFEELEELSRKGTTRPSDGPETLFRCQATELLRASARVRWWSPLSLWRELYSGNVGLRRFVRVMAGAVAHLVRRRLLRRRVVPQLAERDGESTATARGLGVGQLVRVRSREEIAQTLDASGKTRGLHFDFPEMGPYCGRTSRVLSRVERFIDEPSGKMVELSSDAYILEDFACSGDHAPKRWFCPRGIYAWWRESWLEPLGGGGDGATTVPHAPTVTMSACSCVRR